MIVHELPDHHRLPIPPGRGGLGARVRALRRQREMTQVQLAEITGLNQGYLSAIERGHRQPRNGTIRILARALSVPEAMLLGDGIGHDTPQPLELRELPLYGTIPNGPPSASQESVEHFPVLRHMRSADRYCLRCEFDSMEPTLKRGDIILVEFRNDVNPEFVQGRICVCMVDGQTTLKRVTVDRTGGVRRIVLRGDNPDVQPLIVEPSQEFSIQGIAVNLASRQL